MNREMVERAYEQGYDIEARDKNSNHKWESEKNPNWHWDYVEYRVKFKQGDIVNVRDFNEEWRKNDLVYVCKFNDRHFCMTEGNEGANLWDEVQPIVFIPESGDTISASNNGFAWTEAKFINIDEEKYLCKHNGNYKLYKYVKKAY